MLLDTSGLLALLDAREPMHQRAIEEYSARSNMVTHGFVLAELVALANVRGVSPTPVLKFIKTLISHPSIETFWPNEILTGQALSLLMGRQGRGYSLCDAVSFVLMRNKRFVDAFTTDKHFTEEGFRKLL